MKFKGRKLENSLEELVVCPRPALNVPRIVDGEPVLHADGTQVFDKVNNDIVFVVKPVIDFSDLEKLCPEPEPPMKIVKGEGKVQNVEDPAYMQRLDEWYERRSAWMILQSIRDTPDIEFEKVKFDDPATWTLLDAELDESGFLPAERARIMSAILDANGLNADKIDRAREAFLAARQGA